MDVEGVWGSCSLLLGSDSLPDMRKRLEVVCRRWAIQLAVNHHPQTNNKESSNAIEALQTPITNKTYKKSKAQHIRSIILNKSNVIAVIRPFLQKVES